MNDQKLLEYKPEDNHGFYTFYGLELHRFAIPGGTVKLIGKRERGDMPHQVYEIVVTRAKEVFLPNRAMILRDGEEIFSIESHVNFNCTERMAIAALHRLLKDKYRSCHRAKKGGVA